MCDCYDHKCSMCNTYLPIHLADFSTGREEIEVFCTEHIPKENVRVFTMKGTLEINKDNYYVDNPEEFEDFPKGYKIGIRSLTDNAKGNEDGNFPNTIFDWDIENR